MSHYPEQVVSVIRRAGQEILSRGLNDPRVRGRVSVTSVRLSPDGAEATVGVSVLPEKHADLTLNGLKHATMHVQSELNDRVTLRRVPRISFRLDSSLKKEADVLAAINRGRRRDADEGLIPPAEEE
jgi:ribosome-binding factor A